MLEDRWVFFWLGGLRLQKSLATYIRTVRVCIYMHFVYVCTCTVCMCVLKKSYVILSELSTSSQNFMRINHYTYMRDMIF